MTNENIDHMAFKLFKLFAQYEYALKAMGYARAKGQGNTVEAAWDDFANDLGHFLLSAESTEVVSARTLLFDRPPNRQVLVKGQITWAPVPVGNKTRLRRCSDTSGGCGTTCTMAANSTDAGSNQKGLASLSQAP
jgi:hypothetical protein